MSDATIGIALIVKDEAEHLKRLLPQLLGAADDAGRKTFDQVVVVDTGSTDGSAAIARDLGAEVHDFAWVESFGAARNFAQAKLATTWKCWCDADDEWANLPLLRGCLEAIEGATPRATALWLLYDYDARVLPDGTRVTLQSHRRERAVRADADWRWIRRVHECQVRAEPPDPGSMPANDDIVVRHLRLDDRAAERDARNVRLLRLEIGDDPTDPRPWFDLGTQYFNGKRWGRALACYVRYMKLTKSPPELYQARIRAGECRRFLGDPEKASEWYWRAAALDPDLADAWHCLGYVAFARRQVATALRFFRHGYTCAPPIDLLVTNPRDYDLHPMQIEQRCLLALGRVPEALAVVEKALAIYPGHEDLLYVKGLCDQLRSDVETAERAFAVAEVVERDDPARLLDLYKALPERIRRQKEVRDRLLGVVYQQARVPDLTLYCGPTLEDWGPDSPELGGIGGSETAAIALAGRLAAAGLTVDVYNQCGAQEGIRGGVRYLDFRRHADTPTGTFVAWRAPGAARLATRADRRWLWLHDLHLGEGLAAEAVAPFDLIRPVSEWHAGYLAYLYPFMQGRLVATRNGIEPGRFVLPDVARQPHKAIYCSAPDRGLLHLLGLWPHVRARVPDAELHVFYGWQTFDKAQGQARHPFLGLLKQRIQAGLTQPGVIERGRVPQATLARELASAAALAYPTDFLEVSCIAAMEAMAAGCAVLSTALGALPETVGDGGLLLTGAPTSEAYGQLFAKDLIALLTQPAERDAVAARGLARAANFNWDDVAAEWLARLAVAS